ncbi:RluA family pseudouridine synthase [Thermohalobacter berrensis]|uniref:Pseudouridine synthase n=1 Tax=Thermohalobacter berrensis TaxID=99594 RepID=A0A419T298_9FIRM|nr:RluA family pseudouridine synthase [Thermohalobacter berrensis]RKD31551.1 RNA pseudouridine synthase [Thermohalobacter berrensis]
MREIYIGKNEKNQRVDRFLKKYMPEAPSSFIYKMIRKKRIKLNGKRTKPNKILREGDKFQLYLADETIDKFRRDTRVIDVPINLDIIYEDKNIVLINKEKGVLSHSNGKERENTLVQQLISYLHKKGEYDFFKETTFTPSICNRLDRNTSGIVIGAKNFATLQMINEMIRKGKLKKYYKCIVRGEIKKDMDLKGYLVKDKDSNKVYVTKEKTKNGKKIHTFIKVLKRNSDFSLLEVDLITGRSHQIRAHLNFLGHPIIGDNKYGDKDINKMFYDKYGLKNQYLHAYKIVFNDLNPPLDYLNQKVFTAEANKKLKVIEDDLF